LAETRPVKDGAKKGRNHTELRFVAYYSRRPRDLDITSCSGALAVDWWHHARCCEVRQGKRARKEEP
jgi:hypothetical protein